MRILPDHMNLQYSGRIDYDDPKAPVLVFAGSFIRMRFTGTSVKAVIANHRLCWTDYMGYILDGKQEKFALENDSRIRTYTIAEDLEEKEHDLLLFKRQDSCHTITFYGFELDDGAELLEVLELPNRRIEVFGDSVSCGEISEAVDYVGKTDPENDGEYSNSWYSYSWMTARKLNAEVHITSQGGIALMDGTGWFHGPNYVGMESCYDKIEYNDVCGPVKQWDFSLYQPHVVIVAIGQNDSHPDDYMAEDYNGEKANTWRSRYQAFVEKLMERYPSAQFILATTVLEHHKNWDNAIDEVAQKISSDRVHHFLYKQNGTGTPGHIRIPEAEQMAEELSVYINSLGNIWN
ncbi:MAG: electron transporter RnfD [Agathobacter sp.]